ncbi:MAG: ABC transporter permease [Acidimicrobiia bacterium]|nr:ABC transporter permease [Acidimicrobiia bacterium]
MATATRAPRHTRISASHAVKDIAVITRRNLLRNIRLPQLLIFATIQPVMFLLLFNYVFGGAIGGAIPPIAQGEYINWLLPGLLIQVAAFGAGQTALGLTEDLSKGVIDRFRSLPMARSAVLAGRTLSDVIRNGFVIGLMVAMGFLMGFRYQTNFVAFLAGLAVAMVFSYALSWIMATIGLAVKNPEAAQSAVFLGVFPLVFASSVFVPTDTMPAWLQGFALNQPITVTVNALRGLMLGREALADFKPGMSANQVAEAVANAPTVEGQVLLSLGWALAIMIVFVPLAIRVYRRTVS